MAGDAADRRWMGRAFVLMTATLALSVVSNVIVQRRYRR